ncbi:SDR family NAD(P)-dependent oxidoreductase [Acutalibacter sp. 1XD8-36]|uniref:SDR family NAD(P)-dependent oxidoreductase n=1 Tax=Acutalibacter sp. 1XD8-36 TaxID=2320852 RepID=UPI002634DD6D|nr:SDR family oxidoreductase [Acutalibacter sp. 1XD8-36]
MLRGKNVIVTGSNRGIGKAIMEEFARCGCNIWACARKENSEFEEHIERVSKEYGVWIKPIYFDLASEDAIKDGFKQIHGDKLPVDILANNAGIARSGSMFVRTSMRDLRDIYEVNVFAMFTLTQLVLRLMMRQKSGSIVNVASVTGLEAEHHGELAYGTSKAAVISFTRILAAEMAEFGIRVNAVAPGYTDTDMTIPGRKLINENILPNIAMGRLGQPGEIAKVVRFLASEDASFINGEIVKADGGKR